MTLLIALAFSLATVLGSQAFLRHCQFAEPDWGSAAMLLVFTGCSGFAAASAWMELLP